MRFLAIILLFCTMTGFSKPAVTKPTATIRQKSFFEATTSPQRNPKPKPQIDRNVYDKPVVDSRPVHVKNEKLPSVAVKTKFLGVPRDQFSGKVKDRSANSSRSPKYIRKRSHIAE